MIKWLNVQVGLVFLDKKNAYRIKNAFSLVIRREHGAITHSSEAGRRRRVQGRVHGARKATGVWLFEENASSNLFDAIVIVLLHAT